MTPQQSIQNLFESPWQLAVCLTGGGSRIACDLLTKPGSSSTVLEIAIPYSIAALTEYLEQHPDRCCSRTTALDMAVVAWQRARQFATSQDNSVAHCLGISCTASLVSTNRKRGEHRIWIATESATGSRVVSLPLKKGLRTRDEEEAMAADLLLYAINEACNLKPPTLPDLHIDETIAVEHESLHDSIAELRCDSRSIVWSLPDGELTDTVHEPPRGILSGSFNPLHHGHRLLRSVEQDQLEGPVYFELPLINADKPPLNGFEIEQRRRQFSETPVALTASPKFVEKARLFPGVTFVVGHDTAARILQPRFYDDSDKEMRASLEAVGSLGCQFLVAGRMSDSGFQSINDLPIPGDFQDLFLTIPEERFREDVSSSDIRNGTTMK